MSEYQPGTVAIATVKGIEGVRVMRGTSVILNGGPMWLLDRSINGADQYPRAYAYDREVTDVRPLVVLDLAAINVRALVDGLRNVMGGPSALLLADQIEAQTKPARIPEPTGLGAVVEDSEGKFWVRLDDDGDVNKHWRRADMGAMLRHWQIVDAVRVLSEGVPS